MEVFDGSIGLKFEKKKKRRKVRRKGEGRTLDSDGSRHGKQQVRHAPLEEGRKEGMEESKGRKEKRYREEGSKERRKD